jgi:hypothetical protein
LIANFISFSQVKPLINKKLLLEKYPGKGGWTYARVPEIKKDAKTPFGFVKVKGTIDGFEIKQYNIMPMGGGKLFLPVRAEIRKKIKKEAGDTVHVILYHDHDKPEIPSEFLLCLEDEPQALRFFTKITDSERKHYVDWIYSAKHDETKVNRIAKAIDRLARGLKMYDPEK